MSVPFPEFERAVMEMLLKGDDSTLAVLRTQFQDSSVTNREFTGAGFLTTFSVPPTVDRVKGKGAFSFGDVVAEIQGLNNVAGFVLHVREGYIDFLEGYVFDEDWPTQIHGFSLKYTPEEERNLSALKKEWGG